MTHTDGSDPFGTLPPIDDSTLSRLHADLTERAGQDDLLDVAYRTMDTPVGSLLLAATPRGLVRVAYADSGQDAILTALSERVSPRVLHAPARLDLAVRQLDEYFAGHRKAFDLSLDFQLSQGFRLAVHRHLRDIGYGRTETYAAVAAAAGSPAAVRAVGTACRTNPLPVVVPCHRVVRSDGTSGDYVGGAAAKQLLLTMESRH